MQRLSFCSFLAAALCFSMTGGTRKAAADERVTPPLNTEATAQVGGDLLHQGEVYRRAAIHLSEEIVFGKDGAYSLMPGYYFRTGESDGWESYSPADGPDAGSIRKAPGAVTLQGSFLYSNDGQTIGVITNFYQAVNTKAKGITRTTRPAISRDAVQRSVVYGGKTGSRIKLAYREVWKNITRPSRDVFVEFDLSDSQFVYFKEARIEVIEATSEHIRYRIIRALNTTKQ